VTVPITGSDAAPLPSRDYGTAKRVLRYKRTLREGVAAPLKAAKTLALLMIFEGYIVQSIDAPQLALWIPQP
jgi:hypothetical protein